MGSFTPGVSTLGVCFTLILYQITQYFALILLHRITRHYINK